MPITISPPADNGGFDKNAHLDHALLFINVTEESGPTAFGETTWAKIEVVADLDDNSVSRDAAIFGTFLAPSIYGAGTPIVCGRLRQGTSAKPGQSPPWLLENPTDEDLAKAENWADKYVTELPSGALVVDLDAIEPF